MYNLVVSGLAEAWETVSFELERSRVVREHTDETISKRFTTLDGAAVTLLKTLPTIFAYEKGLKSDARIGIITEIRARGYKVRFKWKFIPDLPPLPYPIFDDLAWELEIDETEMYRTHWAVKAVDLPSVLVDANLLTEVQVRRLPHGRAAASSTTVADRLVVTPDVFRIPKHGVELDLVSVMMPFDAGFDHVYSSLQQACNDLGMRCLRADDIWEESAVVQEIFNLLIRSTVVIVDFTGRNPNVMYETGIAHTLGRRVIPITQSYNDVPFDLRHHRVLKYLPNIQGLDEMRKTLSARLAHLKDSSLGRSAS
jgi:hypothetical protein